MTSQAEFSSGFGSIYDNIKQGLAELGYIGGLLQENYQFTDSLGPQLSVRTIPLATFAQEPISYHNACFGVVTANGKSGSTLVEDYRALGDPQIFEIIPQGLRRWRVTSVGDCILLEDIISEHIPSFFIAHKDDWSPNRIGQAKFLRSQNIVAQLDFFDLGLLPLIDYEVRTKLNKLLTDTISLAVEEYSQRAQFTNRDLPPLFRLIFRLIAAKLLNDRSYPGDWISNDVNSIINRVDKFYFKTHRPGLVLTDHITQAFIWERIRKAFHFQNLSVDALAYVYENTLVTKEARQRLAIHGTPPAIAEYVVRNLPFENIPEDERRVFEPFSGQAAFLVAAMKRMRELLSPSLSPQQRHDYFVERLSGMEIDDFALDVAFQSLMLADYPNPDGWCLYQSDVFKSEILDRELSKANIVLCNPPFEEFSPEEKSLYPNRLSTHKPAEILQRVLRKPPKLLGFVLPRIFISGHGYKQVRNELLKIYSSFEIIALPDRVFAHSGAETVLLLASGNKAEKVRLKVGEVYEGSLKSFYTTYKPSYEKEVGLSNPREIFDKGLWLPELEEVWEAMASLPRLSTVADVHRGIEYNIPFKENRHLLVSKEEHPFFKPGLHRVEDGLEAFLVTNRVYLNTDESLMRTGAITLPWEKPKLILNASRRTRGHWKITAAPDYDGLYCYQTFMGVWPRDELSIQFLCAVLNSPVANAFVACHEGQRSIRGETIKGIPIPEIAKADIDQIQKLVNEYANTRQRWLSGNIFLNDTQLLCKALIEKIDAEILKAYDLAPRLERSVLDYFTGHRRPVPVEFIEYYPEDFKPFIPWYLYTSGVLERAAAGATLRRLRVIDDPIVTSALSNLE